MMKHLFLNKELSLKAKDKGFDEECLFFYNDIHYPGELVSNINNSINSDYNTESGSHIIMAPLYQQIIDWFREKHNLSIELTWDSSYEYEPGKWSDAIWSIAIMNLKDSMKNYSPDWQRRSGEQLEYYSALNKAIAEAFKLI